MEKNGSNVVTSDRYFVWQGMRIAEERAPGVSAPTKIFTSFGEIRTGGVKYYYTRDHLGSVREVLDGNSNIVARYDYDPYGVPTQTLGTMHFDMLYTGHFYHWASGLYLAPYRAYNPGMGRWISRDPIGMAGGMNLYAYAYGNPLSLVDPLGLDVLDYIAPPWLINNTSANLSAGFGDALSFGITDAIREASGLNVAVNPCAASYKAGWWGGTALSVATMGVGSLGVSGTCTGVPLDFD